MSGGWKIEAVGNDLTGWELIDPCGCHAECLDPMGGRWSVKECEAHAVLRRSRREARAGKREAKRTRKARRKRCRKRGS